MNTWNNFIDDVCWRKLSSLNSIQRKAVLCFWYDSEMNSGGFCGYQDCYPETDLDELEEAIREIANDEIADNLRKAIDDGEEDDWEETDMNFYAFEPGLDAYLMEYVEKNNSDIFA